MTANSNCVRGHQYVGYCRMGCYEFTTVNTYFGCLLKILVVQKSVAPSGIVTLLAQSGPDAASPTVEQ